MNPPERTPLRTERAWVVSTKTGHPFLDTVRSTRRAAIEAYGIGYAADAKRNGVRPVKCTLAGRGPDD